MVSTLRLLENRGILSRYTQGYGGWDFTLQPLKTFWGDQCDFLKKAIEFLAQLE